MLDRSLNWSGVQENMCIIKGSSSSWGFYWKCLKTNCCIPGMSFARIATYESSGKESDVSITNVHHSTWDVSASKYFSKADGKILLNPEQKGIRRVGKEDGDDSCCSQDAQAEEEDNDGTMNGLRRGKVKSQRIINRIVDKPQVLRWTKPEDRCKTTWKETKVSNQPRMVGEGIYGVGPVLAALTAGRREFYTLYIQEGLDLSGNNKRKKDKRGIQTTLQIAEQIRLPIKKSSKHDLNMVVDNRPHQGVVLDASPLEMVSIMTLEPASVDAGKAPVWVALDEVTDPQNLGAIIRSSYFFGAAGVVLCAKNSAPLSAVASKASAGSLELVELRCCKNMMQFLASSRENKWRVIGGSVSSRAITLSEVGCGEPTILVLGSEGRGLRPLVERSCSELVRIPSNFPLEENDFDGENRMHLGKEYLSFLAVESLNVSVATGILLYQLVGRTFYSQM